MKHFRPCTLLSFTNTTVTFPVKRAFKILQNKTRYLIQLISLSGLIFDDSSFLFMLSFKWLVIRSLYFSPLKTVTDVYNSLQGNMQTLQLSAIIISIRLLAMVSRVHLPLKLCSKSFHSFSAGILNFDVRNWAATGAATDNWNIFEFQCCGF